MKPCPSCAGTLESSAGVPFCAACKATLQPKGGVALALAIAKDDARLVVDRLRPPYPLGPCPQCAKSHLLKGKVLGELVAECNGCGAVWITGGQLARMRALLTKKTASEERAGIKEHTARFHEATFPYDTVAANAFALPAALLVGVLAHAIGLDLFVFATAGMWLHELGHAVVAWLGGFLAVPLPFLTVMPSDERNWLVIALVLGGIVALAVRGVRKRAWGLVGIAGGLAVLQAILTAALNPAQSSKWGLFAGLGGELALSALLMALFYQRLPWRWDFWRYVVLTIAATAFTHALFLWVAVTRGTGTMPHGSAVGDESEGDVERLVRTFHWTKEGLADAYLALGYACLVALACVYAFYLKRALAEARGGKKRGA